MGPSYGCSAYMIASAAVSTIGALSMLGHNYIMHRNKVTRSLYSEIITNLALGCLVNACGAMVGEAKDQSPECWYMGITTNIGSLVAMFWTAYLTYYLHTISKSSEILHDKSLRYKITLYAICWGIPILVTLLPLSHFAIGAPDTYGWCFLVDRGTQTPWGLFAAWWGSFYLWLWISIG